VTNLAPDLKGGKCDQVKTTNQTVLFAYFLEVVMLFVPVLAVSALYASPTYSEMMLNIPNLVNKELGSKIKYTIEHLVLMQYSLILFCQDGKNKPKVIL
jgi:hypothetical protein